MSVKRDALRIGTALALLAGFAAWCLYLIVMVRAERQLVAERVVALVRLQELREAYGHALEKPSVLLQLGQDARALLAERRAARSTTEDGLYAAARVEAALHGLVGEVDAARIRAVNDALTSLTAALRRETGALSASLGERWTHAYLVAALAMLFALGAAVSWLRARRLGQRSERARGALAQVERDLRGVIEHSPVGMLILRDEHIVYANPAAIGYGGALGGPLEGRTLRSIVHPDDHTRMEDGRTKPAQVRWARGGADTLHVEVFPPRDVHFAGGEAQLVVVYDVTERAREAARAQSLAEERAARALAEDAVATREAFISIASHELRTPLTSLRAAVQLLDRALDPERADPTTPSRARAALGVVDRQTKRLSSLVTALLDVTAIQKGRLELRAERCDLAQITRDIVPRLARDANHGSSAVSVDVPETLVGEWDPTRIEQVVSNLVVNALKFGTGRPVRVTLRTTETTAVLEVADQGVGFEPHRAPHLFEAFTRGAGEQFDGLGLGLFVARSIVLAHGGTLHADASPGAGATFRVTLPLRTGLMVDI